MAILLTDAQIASLLAEPKLLPANYSEKIQLKTKSGHRERDLDLTGSSGSEFRLILRESLFNSLAFSVILAYRPAKTTQVIRLRRYNGKNHEHTNTLEKQTFYDFHIHTATERYQAEGLREDTFAQPTNRYADFNGALTCMIADCNFRIPDEEQQHLF